LTEEKVIISSSTGSDLHGIHYQWKKDSEKKSILIICHGFTGDKYEWGRFPKLANSLNKEKIDALIFDFTGSGENERVPITLSNQRLRLMYFGHPPFLSNLQKIKMIGLKI